MSPCALAMQEEKENGCEVIWERVQAADGDGIWNRPDQNNNMAKTVSISPSPFPLQNGWARALYKPTFLVILGVWEMPLAPTIL